MFDALLSNQRQAKPFGHDVSAEVQTALGPSCEQMMWILGMGTPESAPSPEVPDLCGKALLDQWLHERCEPSISVASMSLITSGTGEGSSRGDAQEEALDVLRRETSPGAPNGAIGQPQAPQVAKGFNQLLVPRSSSGMLFPRRPAEVSLGAGKLREPGWIPGNRWGRNSTQRS